MKHICPLKLLSMKTYLLQNAHVQHAAIRERYYMRIEFAEDLQTHANCHGDNALKPCYKQRRIQIYTAQ